MLIRKEFSMPEKNLDFDKIINRKGTDCLKYDFAVRRGKPEDVLPLWIADMDFPTSSYVEEALVERVKHGIFGYSEVGDSYFNAVSGWMKKHHDWEIEPSWLVKTPGVVFALAMAVKAFTKPDDAVLIQQPVYYPFSEVIRDNGRRVISNDLVLSSDGKYHMDFGDFEQKIKENDIHLFFLCSPHNPVSRVWTREELIKLGDICVRHNVIVVSDEIHEDFVFGERMHHVFAALKKEFSDITITCTSPAKTFNLAGLQISNIFIANERLRKSFKREIAAAGYSQLNTTGLVACEAAYKKGETWYREMMKYLEGNILFMDGFIKKNLPELTMINPEGTYLVWVDFKRLGLSENELEDLIVNKARLWLDSGRVFGSTGVGFERFNIACQRATLEKALEALSVAVNG